MRKRRSIDKTPGRSHDASGWLSLRLLVMRFFFLVAFALFVISSLNPRLASFLEGVVANSRRSNYFLKLNATLKTQMKYMMNFIFYFPSYPSKT